MNPEGIHARRELPSRESAAYFQAVRIPQVAKEILGLVGLALLVGGGNFVLNPKAREVFRQRESVWERPVVVDLPGPGSPADTTAYLALRPALELLNLHGALMVSADSVEGMQVLDPRFPEEWVSQLLSLAPDTPIVITDTSAFRYRAWQLARLLWSLGFRRAWVTVVPALELVRHLQEEKP